jgi:hypothetical protein
MYGFPRVKKMYDYDLLLYRLILVGRLYLKDFHQVIVESIYINQNPEEEKKNLVFTI